MNRSLALGFLFLIGTLSGSQAQERAPTVSPYAGFEQRTIKALSAQQMADLRAGRGMGLALAAELNGYPGPLHVLELARELEITDLQRTRVDALFTAMKSETIAIGERLIAEEAALDRQFATHSITPDTLAATVDAIGAAQSALRAAHLKYHLLMMEVLTPLQVRRYAELRGYVNSDVVPHGHREHRQH
jgi:Spy/CpxP family protein refolding chaperone